MDLLRKEARGEEHGHGHGEGVISPSSVLPLANGNGGVRSKFYHGGKCVNNGNGLSLSVPSPSPPAIPGWYADVNPFCPGMRIRTYICKYIYIYARVYVFFLFIKKTPDVEEDSMEERK